MLTNTRLKKMRKLCSICRKICKPEPAYLKIPASFHLIGAWGRAGHGYNNGASAMIANFRSEELHPERSLLINFPTWLPLLRPLARLRQPLQGVLCIFQGGLESVTQPPSWWVMLAKQLTSVPSLKTHPFPQSSICKTAPPSAQELSQKPQSSLILLPLPPTCTPSTRRADLQNKPAHLLLPFSSTPTSHWDNWSIRLALAHLHHWQPKPLESAVHVLDLLNISVIDGLRMKSRPSSSLPCPHPLSFSPSPPQVQLPPHVLNIRSDKPLYF